MSARRYSAEFKKTALERMAGCGNVTALALELGVRRKFLYLWREQMAEHGGRGWGESRVGPRVRQDRQRPGRRHGRAR